MFSNYFKTAWRNLQRSRFYTVINIGGLTAGLTVGILVLLWVQDELSYDSFHKKGDNIIRLENMVATGSNRQLWTVTAAPIGYLAKKDIPGVKDFVRISYNGYYGLFKYGDKIFNEQQTYFTDPSFFSVFDFGLIKGNAADPYPDNQSVVLTESTARKYFGSTDVIGKTITADDSVLFHVTGVIKDIPKNSSITGELFFPMNLLAQKFYAGQNNAGANLENDFKQFNYHTYLLLAPGFSFDGFAKKLRDLHLAIKPEDTDIGYVWLPLSHMHLYTADGRDGGMAYVRLFGIIAGLILLIACINYVNLSTARAMLRAKEVSVRKIVGAARRQLFLQFVVETLVLFLFATGLATLLVYLLLPAFNQLSGKTIVFTLTNWQIWRIILLAVAGTLIISSIYPALLLSSFEPLKALKGKLTAGISSAVFRKALVVVQFCFSVMLISGTVIIGRQLHYMRSMQLGFDKSNVFSFNMINMYAHAEAVRSDLLKNRAISDVTWANTSMIDNQQQTGNNDWDGKGTNETMMLSPWGVDKNFLSFFKLSFTTGSGFTGVPADSMHFILNEAAVKAARIKNPIGKRFRLWQTEGTIIGVVKDFHFTSLHDKIKPAVFYYRPKGYGKMFVKTTGVQSTAAIAATEAEWKKYNAGYAFDYRFLDDTYDMLYKSEARTGILFNIFAAFAVFISCLGLFGLTTYTAQVRTKEIGIRKTLGASTALIVRLLTFDFIRLVLLAIVIAIPVAWYGADKWLAHYAYKISPAWYLFAGAGILVIGVSFITISFQSIKAARANPVKALRTE